MERIQVFELVGNDVAQTRPLGRQCREHLEALLAEAPEDEVVVVSFEGIEVMTGSFTDEFLGKLVTAASGWTHRQGALVTHRPQRRDRIRARTLPWSPQDASGLGARRNGAPAWW